MKALFLSLLLLLPNQSAAAAATLKGTQLKLNEAPPRLLKKEDDPALAVDATHAPATLEPTAWPTPTPSLVPTASPSSGPSFKPSTEPTVSPSVSISSAPSESASDVIDVIATLAPTMDVATNSPVSSTAAPSDTAIVATDSPTSRPVIGSTTSSTVISKPTSTTTDNSFSISILPLKPFRVDFVSTIRHDDVTDNHGNKLLLRGRQLESFFESTQDAELVHIISNHIQAHLTEFGDVMAVQLKIMSKDESVFGKLSDSNQDDDNTPGSRRNLRSDLSLILVSYTMEGEVLLANASPVVNDKLEEATLHSFTGEKEQASLLTTLSTSNDKILRSITDVDATSVISFDYANNEIQSTSNTNNTSAPTTTTKVNILFPTLIGLAFLSTLSAISFLIHRKYSEYKNNEYASYQQRKRAYNHFESPESSITENVTPTSRDENKIVFSYDYSVEESSSEDERGWSSASTSTDVLDWNVPFDEHSLGAKQQQQMMMMPYEDQTKMELQMIQMGTAVGEEGAIIKAGTVRSVPVSGMMDESQSQMSLDGLYSTADSYFDSTTVKNRNQRCDSIDTLNCSTDQYGAFGPGWEREVKFEGVMEVMKREELVTDVTKILLENCVTEKACEDAAAPSSQDPVTHRKSDKSENEAMIKDEGSHDASPDLTAKNSSYKSMYFASDHTALSKANISAGIFTQETLGMINRNRLKSTPPPSENDYDEDIVNDAKQNTLLGQWKTESDSEEEESLSLFDDGGVKAASPGYCLDRIG